MAASPPPALVAFSLVTALLADRTGHETTPSAARRVAVRVAAETVADPVAATVVLVQMAGTIADFLELEAARRHAQVDELLVAIGLVLARGANEPPAG